MEFKELEFDPSADEGSKSCDFCFRSEFAVIIENPSSGELLKMYEDADGENIWCEVCKDNYDAVIAEHPIVEHFPQVQI